MNRNQQISCALTQKEPKDHICKPRRESCGSPGELVLYKRSNGLTAETWLVHLALSFLKLVKLQIKQYSMVLKLYS